MQFELDENKGLDDDDEDNDQCKRRLLEEDESEKNVELENTH